jgi:hypothetical protein
MSVVLLQLCKDVLNDEFDDGSHEKTYLQARKCLHTASR